MDLTNFHNTRYCGHRVTDNGKNSIGICSALGGVDENACMPTRLLVWRKQTLARTSRSMHQLTHVVGRLIVPFCCAVALIGAVELSLQLTLRPMFLEKTNWLLHDPYRPEVFDRLVLYEKLSTLENTDPDVIMVGDSTGFFSIQPTIVNRYTHGLTVENFSTGANYAYDGYKAIAEYMLRRSTRIKFVVLYVYPTLLPSDEIIARADLGRIAYRDLISINSNLMPPSAALSVYAKFGLFQHQYYHKGDYLSNQAPYLEFANAVSDTLGWEPEYDTRFKRYVGQLSFYPKSEETWFDTFRTVLGDFDRMVRSYGAKLVIVFAPVPAYSFKPADADELALRLALARFQSSFPDVEFLTPLITTFSDEKFGMFNHVSREYTFLSSARLGIALRTLFDHNAPDQKSILQQSVNDGRRSISVNWHPLAIPNPAALRAGTAFYMYAATTDDTYRDRISKRVLGELSKEQAFNFMIQDARRRVADLRQKNIAFGFDLSGLEAEPVEVSGLTHCNTNQNIQWVHIAGVIKFHIQSQHFSGEESIRWPSESNILIPTVVEDGVQKFDGYCRELMMGNVEILPK
jgi:hypothetical protein